MHRTLAALTLVLASYPAAAQPIVIADTVNLAAPGSFLFAELDLEVVTLKGLMPSADGSGPVPFDDGVMGINYISIPRLDPETQQLEIAYLFDDFTARLDGPGTWFLVKPGSVLRRTDSLFSRDGVTDGTLFGTSFEASRDFLTRTDRGHSVFFGFNAFETIFDPDGASFDGPEISVFGWVEIELPLPFGDQFEPRVLSSATAYNSAGIIVGTLTAIPEPAGATLLAMIAMPAAMLRRLG